MKLCYVDLQTSNKRSREILNNPLPTKVLKDMKALYGTGFALKKDGQQGDFPG